MQSASQDRFLPIKTMIAHGNRRAARRALLAVGHDEPHVLEAWMRLGHADSLAGDYAGALEAYDYVLLMEPAFAEARFARALALLAVGRYAEGFAEYEARWDLPAFQARNGSLRQPAWNGEPLDGKTLHVYPEQGFGDVIQCARFLPLLRDRGARVVLQVFPQLRKLFEFQRFADALTEDDTVVADYRVPVMSLPRLMAAEAEAIPGRAGYLRAPARADLDVPYLTVGLVWHGSSGHPDNAWRALSAPGLEALLTVPGVLFVSLQLGEIRHELASIRGGDAVIDAAPFIRDFNDTATLIASLDLVISIDTATAHLAGALGRPVWLLLSHMGEWRYTESGSPWYDSMRVFRQARPGDWAGAIARIGGALVDAAREKGCL